MDRSVTVPGTALTTIKRERAFNEAKRYAKKSRSDATWRAYRSDWAVFAYSGDSDHRYWFYSITRFS